MAKEAIKQELKKIQNGVSALTGEDLPHEFMLYDTDRITPKADGGTYHLENTRLVLPLEHMERHLTLRERTPEEQELKTLCDERANLMRLRLRIENQKRAAKRRVDQLSAEAVEVLGNVKDQVAGLERAGEKKIAAWLKQHSTPLIESALGVHAVGPITVAFLTVYVDLKKAKHASSLWAYCGLHAASHQRYKKGQISGGNKTLRTVLYNLANSQISSKGPYEPIYRAYKERLEHSQNITATRNTKGFLVQLPWCETKPGHRHGAALRQIMKYFLADYWYVGRTIMGLPTTPLYVVSQLGHERPVDPSSRGWKYEEAHADGDQG